MRYTHCGVTWEASEHSDGAASAAARECLTCGAQADPEKKRKTKKRGKK